MFADAREDEAARGLGEYVEMSWQTTCVRKAPPGVRGGLIAFDVGVGKTYTALAMIARARQEGRGRRPVILVPAAMMGIGREQEEGSG